MKTLDELFQNAVNKPNYQLVAEAKANLATVAKYLYIITPKEDYPVAIMAMICTFVAADGKVSNGEFEFVQSVLETTIDYDAFFNSVQVSLDTNMVETFDNMIDNAPDDIKAAFLSLCMDFIACDGEITPDEKELLFKYLM